MRKHHLADALTILEIAMIVDLIGLTVHRSQPESALAAFIFGELCGVLSDICNYKLPYPREENDRWWHTPNAARAIKLIVSAALLIACACYLMRQPNATSIAAACATPLIIVIYIAIERYTRIAPRLTAERRTEIALYRRYLYIICVIGYIMVLIYLTSWPINFKYLLYGLNAILSIVVVICKWEELNKNCETFPEFVRRVCITYF